MEEYFLMQLHVFTEMQSDKADIPQHASLHGAWWSTWWRGMEQMEDTERAVGGETRGVTWVGTAIGIVGRHGTNGRHRDGVGHPGLAVFTRILGLAHKLMVLMTFVQNTSGSQRQLQIP